MPQETTVQFIAILLTVAGLLGWLIKTIIGFFIASTKEKTKYIEVLIGQNQENVKNFTDTINHQRTLDREMQAKHLTAINSLKNELEMTNKVNNRILEFLKNGKVKTNE